MITITRQPDGLTLRTDKRTQKSQVYAAIKRAGFEITDAERENIPLCSAVELLKNPAGEIFFYPEISIRSITDALNNAWERSIDETWNRHAQPELFMPIAEDEI